MWTFTYCFLIPYTVALILGYICYLICRKQELSEVDHYRVAMTGFHLTYMPFWLISNISVNNGFDPLFFLVFTSFYCAQAYYLVIRRELFNYPEYHPRFRRYDQ